MAYSVDTKVLRSIIEANLEEFTAQLVCDSEFLEYFHRSQIFQPFEIKSIKNEIDQRSRIFIKAFLENLNENSAMTLNAALHSTQQLALYNKLMYSDQFWMADEADVKNYEIKSVTPCGQAMLDNYSSGRLRAYKMSKEKRGHCLIINVREFNRSDLKLRHGSDEDVANLEKVFGELQFEVDKELDLEADEITKKVEQFVSKISKLDLHRCGMVVLVLMSHGDRDGCIYGKDGKQVDRYDLYRKVYSCKDLKGRPKLFVVQACAGGDRIEANQCEKPEEFGTDRTLGSPEDTLIINSSFEGFLSWRNTEYGSYFIRALAQVLAEYSCQWHLERICKLVQKKIREKQPVKILNLKTGLHEWYHIPVPCYFNFLQKKLYLLPGLEDSDISYTAEEVDVPEDVLYNYTQPCNIMELKACKEELKNSAHSREVYWMVEGKRGRCLIINIANFTNGDLERPGSNEDANELKGLFETLDFDVQLLKDLTKKEIEDVMDAELTLDLTTYSMFVLVLMSHGHKRSCILDKNCYPVDQHEIRMKVFNCEALKGKPKFFIVEAGVAGDFACLENKNYQARKQRVSVDDALILDSCLDGVGQQSVDGNRSLFIRILVYLLYHHSHEWHLEKICKKVQHEMRKFCKEKVDSPVQIACYAYFLQKKLFLFPGLELNGCEQLDDVTENEDVKAITGCEQLDDVTENEDVKAITVAKINKKDSRGMSANNYDTKCEPGSTLGTGDEWNEVIEGENAVIHAPERTDILYPKKRLKSLPKANANNMEGCE